MTATPTIDISVSELQVVQRILRHQVPGMEVRAFGSRVTGRARPYSDLDLVVMTQSPLPLPRLAALREAFSESDLPWKVDLIDWASTSDRFRAVIEQRHEVIQPSE